MKDQQNIASANGMDLTLEREKAIPSDPRFAATFAEPERRQGELQLVHAPKPQSIEQVTALLAHEVNTPLQYLSDNIHFLQTAFADLKLSPVAQGNIPTPRPLFETRETSSQTNLEFLAKEIPHAIQQSLDGVDRIGRIVRALQDFSNSRASEKTAAALLQALATANAKAGRAS